MEIGTTITVIRERVPQEGKMLTHARTDQRAIPSLQPFGRDVKFLYLTKMGPQRQLFRGPKGLPGASTALLHEAVIPKRLSEELRKDFT